MGLNRDAFVANYLEELSDNLAVVDNGILVLKKDTGNEDELTRLLRALHTIKGSSRMLKFNTVERVAHGLENVFKGVREARYGISGDLIQLVFVTTDFMRAAADRIREVGSDELAAADLLMAYEYAYANEPYDVQSLRLAVPKAGTDGAVAVPTATKASPEGETRSATRPGIGRTADSEREFETIRINVNQIEKIVKLLNNLIIRQFQLRKEKEVLADLESRANALSRFSPRDDGQSSAYNQEIGAFREDLQILKKAFVEELPQIERSIFELQEEILSLRMLPLELILGSLGKMVEETAILMEKEIAFTTQGTELKLDKFILERLHDPIIHLVRNAIDHGIESAAEREVAGKPREGSLQIRCSSEGGAIVIRIHDDGRGFDYDKIRQRAIEMHPQQQEEIEEMTEAALNTYLFISGFSTKDDISDLSGRGVGLDIVKFNIEKMKGKISVSSEKGVGTEFRLDLPLSLATVNGFFVAAAGEKFLIPAAYVREVVIVHPEEELDLLNRKGYKLRDMIIPLYPLSAILDKESDAPIQSIKRFVVVVESLGEIVGMVVDAVIQYNSLIYKPVPHNLTGLRSIQGIVFDENYNIINILYIPEIVKRFKRIRHIDTRRRFSAASREYKKVLVVDDSFSTREIEKSILELEQYNVTTAIDGIDGLEKLKEQHFNLIITDINMPRMDGLTFIENLRKEERYRSIPVIVISSEGDADRRRQFRDIGADRFLLKSDFDRGNLVREVKALIG
jgi:two-component system, chemotaxis family, sensor kinase CheA